MNENANEPNSEPGPVTESAWVAVPWFFHFLSFFTLISGLLFFQLCRFDWFRPVMVLVIDTLFGEGTARDAQGGAFGMIWIILGSFGLSLISCYLGWVISLDFPSLRRLKIAKVNLIAILIGFILLLFSCFVPALLFPFVQDQ